MFSSVKRALCDDLHCNFPTNSIKDLVIVIPGQRSLPLHDHQSITTFTNTLFHNDSSHRVLVSCARHRTRTPITTVRIDTIDARSVQSACLRTAIVTISYTAIGTISALMDRRKYSSVRNVFQTWTCFRSWPSFSNFTISDIVSSGTSLSVCDFVTLSGRSTTVSPDSADLVSSAKHLSPALCYHVCLNSWRET